MDRRIRSGCSYLAQSELAVTFGLGNMDNVDSLIVGWTGGRIDIFSDVGANKHYLIIEGSRRLEEMSLDGAMR